VIRRGFWLTVGAVAGIAGYRRVCAVGRRVSASLTPGGGPARPAGGRLTRGGAASLAGQALRFTRDVREGMELYRLTHSAPAGSTLGARDLDTARGVGSDDDPQPKEGR
jgi:hypothetical protein